jgi:arylsulfatase A-like enzyme
MDKITRREFISTPPKILAAAALAGSIGMLPACSGSTSGGRIPPNLLLIMVDQMQTPPEGYGADEGAAQGLKEILGFRPLSPDNAYLNYFPGLLRLRQNAVVMRKHYTASAACVPSRTCIMTGQYSGVTGVDQTDGLFKTAEDVPFLDPDGTPTVGDWFRAAGYTTHYFGKWHVSEADEATAYLESWGFGDWESSYPEPHGGAADNLGVFRDVIFTEKIVDFLKKKGADASGKPWFAVGSLVNPHDISAWPINWQVPGGTGVVPWTLPPAVPPFPPVYPPPSIPAPGEKSRVGTVRTVDNGAAVERKFQVDLNPDGFPQANSGLPVTYAETLEQKPRCQQDYALKWGLAIESSSDNGLQGTPFKSPLPFQLQGQYARDWSQSYNQFYFYCHYLADLQIRKILNALDENKLTGNTIIVFLADHGDMTGAHGGMIQKWHNAYEEIIRVPMVISSPLINADKHNMREILEPTSSIDFVPTALGLAKIDAAQLRAKMEAVHGKGVVKPFPGADLSAQIQAAGPGNILGPDGQPRAGVFFMSNDTITALGPTGDKQALYDLYKDNVDARIGQGHPLAAGSVRQPNSVRALCTGDWKLVHYVDPNGLEADEWECYCLTADAREQTNLVDFRTGEVRADVAVPGLTPAQLNLKCTQLRRELARQETAILG